MDDYYAQLFAGYTSEELLSPFLQWFRELDAGVERGSEENWATEKGVIVGEVNVESWVSERKALFRS